MMRSWMVDLAAAVETALFASTVCAVEEASVEKSSGFDSTQLQQQKRNRKEINLLYLCAKCS